MGIALRLIGSVSRLCTLILFPEQQQIHTPQTPTIIIQLPKIWNIPHPYNPQSISGVCLLSWGVLLEWQMALYNI